LQKEVEKEHYNNSILENGTSITQPVTIRDLQDK